MPEPNNERAIWLWLLFMMIKSLEDWIKFEALVFLDFNFDKQDYNKTVVN